MIKGEIAQDINRFAKPWYKYTKQMYTILILGINVL